ncbi:hypothetical protein PCANB_001141 [Pneumocystis canis]|nr:hypothetical protein PCK1_001213 [Pneumocystis canis]KAG5437165.1 hypothetical protein PCANB_001141 [Pneumocystis canis]
MKEETALSKENIGYLFFRGFLPSVAVLSSNDADELAINKGFTCLMDMLSLFGEESINKTSEQPLLGLRFVPLEWPTNSLETQLEWIEDCVAYHINLLEKYMISSENTFNLKTETETHEKMPVEMSIKSLNSSQTIIKNETSLKIPKHLDSTTIYKEPLDVLIKDSEQEKKSAENLTLPETSVVDTFVENSEPEKIQSSHIPFETSAKNTTLDLSSAFNLYFRLLTSLPPSAHESFTHPVACICAVSSYSSAPLEALESLLKQRSNALLPSYINLGYLQIYLFIHDDSHDFEKSLQIFKTIQKTFGAHTYLIKLSSLRQTQNEVQDSLVSITKNLWDMSFNPFKNVHYQFYDYTNLSDKLHGLSHNDISAIRMFIKELISQSIIPVMKRSIDTWNEQFAMPRKGISGKLLSVSRRYFTAGIARNTASLHQNGNYDITTSSYPSSSPEAQLRKLADYAFMLHDWKLAQSVYELLKKDFLDDNAWKYYAGAQEMSVFCLLLLPAHSSKVKVETIDAMLEASLYSYLSQCSSPFFALRSIILASELMALRSDKAKNDAARWLIKILEAGIVGNTISALLTERISNYFGSIKALGALEYGSRHKKAAFWKVLAAEAWLRLGKKCFAQKLLEDAMIVYRNIQWPEIIDFMNTLLRAAYT